MDENSRMTDELVGARGDLEAFEALVKKIRKMQMPSE
jgi:hypothetical protein